MAAHSGSLDQLGADGLQRGDDHVTILGLQLGHLLNDTDPTPRAFLAVKNMHIDAISVFGPQFLNAMIYPALTGGVLALTGVYFLFFRGSDRDHWVIQSGVIICALIFVTNSVVLIDLANHDLLLNILKPEGRDMRLVGWQLPVVLCTETISMALGQLYSLARTAKFFNKTARTVYHVGGVFLCSFALVLGNIGPIRVFSKTLDWFKILANREQYDFLYISQTGYLGMNIVTDIYLLLGLLTKLAQLRRRSKVRCINAVMYKLGLLNAQCNVILLLLFLFVIVAHSRESTGFFLTALLASHPIHTMSVLFNLIYRRSMITELAQGQSGEVAVSATPVRSDMADIEMHPHSSKSISERSKTSGSAAGERALQRNASITSGSRGCHAVAHAPSPSDGGGWEEEFELVRNYGQPARPSSTYLGNACEHHEASQYHRERGGGEGGGCASGCSYNASSGPTDAFAVENVAPTPRSSSYAHAAAPEPTHNRFFTEKQMRS